MDIRRPTTASPWRVAGAALAVILLFAVSFPFVGGIAEPIPNENNVVIYKLTLSDFSPYYAALIFLKSLHLSVQTFTLAGSTDLTPLAGARFLADAESLLGMAFLALFTASLVGEE